MHYIEQCKDLFSDVEKDLTIHHQINADFSNEEQSLRKANLLLAWLAMKGYPLSVFSKKSSLNIKVNEQGRIHKLHSESFKGFHAKVKDVFSSVKLVHVEESNLPIIERLLFEWIQHNQPKSAKVFSNVSNYVFINTQTKYILSDFLQFCCGSSALANRNYLVDKNLIEVDNSNHFKITNKQLLRFIASSPETNNFKRFVKKLENSVDLQNL